MDKRELKNKIKELELSIKQKTNYSRKAILRRDNYTCRLCGQRDTILNVHHLYPRELGGTEHPENRLTLCKSCHLFMHCNPKLILLEKQKQSLRTIEGLIRLKAEGKILGRPKGSKDSNPRKVRGVPNNNFLPTYELNQTEHQ